MNATCRVSLCLALFATLALGQSRPQRSLRYLLSYDAPGNPIVRVAINPEPPQPAPLALVMPRSYPGGYQQLPYDSFLSNLYAFSPDHAELPTQRDPDGPRWQIGRAGQSVGKITYEIDGARMERDLLSAVDSSKLRPGYAGLLGYSIFAFLDGLESEPVSLTINAPPQWPVLSTLDPRIPPATAHLTVNAPDYDHLADSQILIGPDLHVSRIEAAHKESTVSLIMAAYAEAPADLDAESHLAREALDRVSAYFAPAGAALAHYTVQLELLKPLPGHDYDFSQEHFDSGTFVRSIDRAISAKTSEQQTDRLLFGYAHHMAHSWIPKRAYGVGYSPFPWEITPALDTVWFNEGFGQYAALEALVAPMSPAEAGAFRESHLNRYREVLRTAPPVIQRLPLLELSRAASFLYSKDFRMGMNSFSRGALLAAEMDDSIRATTHNSKSLRDALCALIASTDKTHQPFAIDQLPAILADSTGADAAALRAILTRWLAPPQPR